MQLIVYGLPVEGFGIELSAMPGHKAPVLAVFGIRHNSVQLLIAGRTPTIFWWTGPLTGDAHWIMTSDLRPTDLLDNYLVQPAVSKVVLIDEAGVSAGGNL